MHGDAAGRALAATARVRLELAGRRSLDELDADAVIVAVPPREAAALLGEDPPALEDSPIVSVHLLVRPAAPRRIRSLRCSTRPPTGSSTAAP